MDIGLNIAEGVRVRVGDTLEDLIDSMESHKIDYDVAYKEQTSTGNIDMVIFMQKYGVELNIQSDKISYIKSNNTDANYIMQLEYGMTPITALQMIKTNLAESFSIQASDIRIDRFDGKTLNSFLSIPVSSREKVKLELVMGAHQKVYLHAIELLH